MTDCHLSKFSCLIGLFLTQTGSKLAQVGRLTRLLLLLSATRRLSGRSSPYNRFYENKLTVNMGIFSSSEVELKSSPSIRTTATVRNLKTTSKNHRWPRIRLNHPARRLLGGSGRRGKNSTLCLLPDSCENLRQKCL